MDLAFKDVVEFLDVSEEKLKAWVKAGEIPAYRVQGEYFFSKESIDTWLIQNNLDRTSWEGSGDKEPGSLHYALFRAIHKGEVLHQVAAKTKEELISLATKEIARKINVDEEMLTALLVEREQLMSTGLGNGVGVPHTRDFLLPDHQDAVFVVFPEQSIEWGSLDNKPVEVLFFLLACEDRRHLHLLSKIAHLSLEKESLNFLKGRPTKHEILKFVRNWEGRLSSSRNQPSLEEALT
ncbi:MAG: PTS transporter subunit EIIA [Chlamydiales bacterium]|nr:PTS sugar transporter subunit IIA [Chlamydiales bacterium]NCF70197.1 PTS transporter subunit EIIA [Chlamydiales bacterium]